MKQQPLIHQSTVVNKKVAGSVFNGREIIDAVSTCVLAMSLTFTAHAQDQALPQAPTALQRPSASSNQASHRHEAKAPAALTESQRILAKLMDDIRTCDKTVRYEYDSKTRHVNPPELKKIKGLKLKKLYREIAVFEINEDYEGLRATVLTTGRSKMPNIPPIHSIGFESKFKIARQRLEQLWHVQFENGIRPGPEVILNGLYAETTILVDNKSRTLSIAKMPADVYPHIAKPEVGCNHFEY